MAVSVEMYGDKNKTPMYEGAVLDTYEYNGREDSDWYAVCWDDEQQEIVTVEYDTTRAASNGWAVIDATEETLRKAYRFYYRQGRTLFDTVTNEKNAKVIEKGIDVRVIRGRKIPQGTIAEVFWIGPRMNVYSRREEKRVGIKISGEAIFLPIEYVEPVDWQNRMKHGKERKKAIRNFAINSMPYWCRTNFAV